MEQLKCKKCLCTDYETVQAGQHIKAICAKCKSYIKFLPQSDEPMEKMPFGKFKDWRFEEIHDKQYLDWLLLSSGKANNKRLRAAIEKRLLQL